MNKRTLIAIMILAAIVLIAIFWRTNPTQVLGSAGGGQAGFATTSTIQVGPQEDKTLFAANNNCANRVISTQGVSAIMLSFQSTLNPGGVTGHPQAASTTESYDSDLFGCRAVTAYAFASTTITLTEFSQ